MTIDLRQLLSAALIFAIAIGIWLFTAELDMGTVRSMGPRFVPLLVAGLLAMFGVVLALQAVRPAEPDPEGSQSFPWRASLRNLVLVVGPILFFAYGIKDLGLVMTAFITSMAAARAAWDITWRQAFVFSVTLTVFSVLLFKVGLGVPVPVLPLW